jgi:hypothetical protein
MRCDIGHVLVLSMVFEVGVETEAPFWRDEEKQPADVVVEARDDPWRQSVLEK